MAQTATPNLVELRRNLRREGREFSGHRLELREGANGPIFDGYASMVDVPYEVTDQWGTFKETMCRGAFDKSLRDGADVKLLYNHDGMVLARTRSGTLSLDTRNQSGDLRAVAPLDVANPHAAALASALRRRDLDKMSIGFRMVRDEWNAEGTERRVIEAALFDVSVVDDPASPSTSACLRAAYRGYDTNVGGVNTLIGSDTAGQSGTGGGGPNAPAVSKGDLAQTSETSSTMIPGTLVEGSLGNTTTGVPDGFDRGFGVDTLGDAGSGGDGPSAPHAPGFHYTANTEFFGAPGIVNANGVPTGTPAALGNDTSIPAGTPTANVNIAEVLARLAAVGAPPELITAILSVYARRSRGRGEGRADVVTAQLEPDFGPLLLRADLLIDQLDDVMDQLLAASGLNDADDENTVNADQSNMTDVGSNIITGNGAAGDGYSRYQTLIDLWERRRPDDAPLARR